MATKGEFLFSQNKLQSFVNNNSHHISENGNQYSNFNLNQNCPVLIPLQSISKPYNDKYYATFKLPDSTLSDNIFERREKSWSLKELSDSGLHSVKLDKKVEKFCKKDDSTKNNSTLSLHITAYENLINISASDSFDGKNGEGLKKEKSWLIKDSKQHFASTFVTQSLQNPFEFPRQQNDKIPLPEVSQFKTSQRLFNPNEAIGTYNSKMATPQIVQPPLPDYPNISQLSNPYINPSPELHYYTENFKEFPIIVPSDLPFFPVAIYKIAVIKSVERTILNAIDAANFVAKEFLNHIQTSVQNMKEREEELQQSLIKPTANAMQRIMNLSYFQQQLCWVLSEFNIKSGLNISAGQLATVANILVDENITHVLEQVASKACKSVFSLIQDLVKEAITKQSYNQSMQSAKVMYGSYLSPTAPSAFTSSLVQPEAVSPTYPTVKNIPPEFANSRRSSSQGYSSDFVLPSDFMNQL